MPRTKPPFVEVWRDRHGRIRIYFRKDRGPRIPMPGKIGSAEFEAAYQAALAGRLDLDQARPVPRRDEADTLGGLITSYTKSAEYLSLRESSRRAYWGRLQLIRGEHGHRSLTGLTR